MYLKFDLILMFQLLLSYLLYLQNHLFHLFVLNLKFQLLLMNLQFLMILKILSYLKCLMFDLLLMFQPHLNYLLYLLNQMILKNH
jgi:hypothetical protein